ncbi:hypothetical protein [Streptomyces sp. NPDC086766]|uniref:hypothetical protein n=1 Tax=Streptomyces sp. NPDC086766 TaxID=3365754 RepID=UPI003815E69B
MAAAPPKVLAAGHGDRGFTAFALAGVSSTVLIGLVALRSAKRPAQGGARRELLTTG